MAPGSIRAFMRSPLIGWAAKLRMLCDLLLPRRRNDAGDESLAQFVRRRFGRTALARIAQPMVGGIYTADPEQLSLAATLPLFLELEREHRSVILGLRRRRAADKALAGAGGPRYGLFVSLRAGLAQLIESLTNSLSDCDLRLGERALTIEKNARGFGVTTPRGSIQADQIVVALPAYAASALCGAIDRELDETLSSIPYAGVATINFIFAANEIPPLPQAAGVVIPASEGRTTIACTFSSNKYAGRTADGATALRAFVGGALHPDALARTDDELIAAVRRDLSELLGITATPRCARVHRWPRSMAQYTIGHRERVAKIRAREAAIGDLALVGNGYEGVGIPDIAAQADAAAARLAARW
jgi:protoporphyrinogen/coproporphyrinogen III oxidase